MAIACIILGCSIGVLVAGAALVAGFSWWIAVLAYFGFGVLGLITGAVISWFRGGDRLEDE